MKRFVEFIKESSISKDEWFVAVSDGNDTEVKRLIKLGIDVNIKDDDGATALLYCCADESENSYEVIDLLLKHPKIDVNAKSCHNWSCLMLAAYNSKELDREFYDNLVTRLLEHPDIDINVKSEQGENFIDLLGEYNGFLESIILQKKILENGREDILMMFDKYGLVIPDIKKENPKLFQAIDWGLI